LKPLDEIVPRKLGEILIAHGQCALTDARLCENLLKDYCGEYKEEISLLVLGVKERIAIDLLLSQDAVEPDVLRSLLTTRLRRNNSLSDSHARWIVNSWSRALCTLTSATARFSSAKNAVSASGSLAEKARPASVLIHRQWPLGVIWKSEAAMRSVAVSPLGDIIAAGGDDGAVRIWNAPNGQIRILEQCSGPVSVVRFSPNGVLLATVSEEKQTAKSRVRVWDLQSNEPLDLGEVGKRSPSLAFSPGGTRLACGSAERDGVIRVWNLQNGQARVLKGPWGGPSSISISPSGEFIAAADATLLDVRIRLWNLETGAAEILGHSNRQVTSVAFSPDGASLASGSWDETVSLWNVGNKKVRVLGRDCACVSCIAFSSEGDKVAACSLDSKIRIWDVTTGRCHNIGLCDNVNDVVFAQDGRVLATASSDGTIRLWDSLLT
jgi:WD40 repeat protein